MTVRRGATTLLAPALLLGLMVAPATSPASAEVPAPAPRATTPLTEGTTDQIIVTTKSSVPATTLEAATEEAASEVGLDLGADATARVTRVTRVVKLSEALPLSELEDLTEELEDSDGIVSATPDARVRPAVTLPSDTYAGSQWGLWQSSPANGGFSSRAIPAWGRSTGAGTVVAVLDTGITAHPDLDANVIPGYDFINDLFTANDGDRRDGDASDPGDWITAAEEMAQGYDMYGNPYCPEDNSSWHGTHVAGTVGAVTNNALGVAGIAPDVRIQPVRVLGKCGGYMSDIAAAITWASGGSVPGVPANATPADVLNLSLGGYSRSGCDATMQSAIDGAVGRGATVVVAAGNSGLDVTFGRNDAYPYAGFVPATCDNVVTVASHASNGARSSFSNYGSLVEISGPGEDILSTINTGLTGPLAPTNSASDYKSHSGTSMATPHVAAAAALVRSARPDLTPAQVTANLQTTAQSFASNSPCINQCGSGYVDAAAAVVAATTPGPVTSVTGLPDDDTTVTISWAAPANTGGHAIEYYTVEHSTDDSTWTADDTTTSLTATINGLTPSTPHRFRIAAVNVLGAGVGVLSGLITPRTLTVPAAPQTVSASAGNGTLTVTWAAPADDGGRPVTSYAVQHSTDDSTWTALAPVVGSLTTITGLVNDQAYAVRVAATSTMGTGAWATTTGTPMAPPPPPPPPPPAPAPPPSPPAPVIAAPGAPVITEIGASDRTVMALWRASDDTGGEEPSEFVVELAGPDGTQTRTTPITYEEFGDLVNGAAYRVRVAASNSAGTGDFSGWSDEVTPIGFAAAPTGLTGTAFDGGVDLRWVAPDDTGGAPIEVYVVSWVSDGIKVALTTEETSIRLETLANGTRYAFRVAAQTEAGVGAWSTALSLTPRTAPVTAPEGLTATSTGRRLVVTWSAPSLGDPKRYVVAASMNGGPYRIKRSTDSTRVTLSLPKRTATVFVRVFAVDSYGRGPWSEPVQARLKKRR